MMATGLDQLKAEARQRNTGFKQRDAASVLSQIPRRRRFVRFMKFILPTIAVGMLMTVLAWPQLSKRQGLLSLSLTAVESDNAALVMNNPRYRGSDSGGQPYVVTADRAVQDPQDDKQVTLDRVQADFSMNDGQWWSLSADTGVYNGTAQLLDLFGNIAVFSDRGYEMHGHTAEVNLETKVISSDEKVWGQMDMGMINANGLRVYDKGRVIVFINGVKTTIFAQNKRG
jgi:lipopolysaccharide export system protein LptC